MHLAAIVRETFALTNRHLIRVPASEGVLRLISNAHHPTADAGKGMSGTIDVQSGSERTQ